jgi:hypothetical protein
MKKFLVMLLFISMSYNLLSQSNRYEKCYCVITSIAQDKPSGCISVFVKMVNTNLYTEFNSCGGFIINEHNERAAYKDFTTKMKGTKWLYENAVNDTIYFDYLAKDRFFELKKR